MAKRPGGAMIQNSFPTQSQLFPIFTKWGELGTKSQLLPMLVTIVAVSFMFMYSGNTSPWIYDTGHPQYWIYTSPFILIVATYLTLLSLYFIYRLVGKRKSWIAMLSCTAFTGLYIWLMMTQGGFPFHQIYTFFHQTLAGGEAGDNDPFLTLFYRHFVGTGFFEEFVKAFPLFAIIYGFKYMTPSMKAIFKLEEPLDGILFGAAAGGGFALVETIGQYVPRNLVNTWMGLALDLQGVKHGYNIPIFDDANLAWNLIQKGMNLMGTSPGVQLLIPRSLDQAFGHMAYSGIFGYFIGLAQMRKGSKWPIYLIGLCTAALPHALWDSVGIFDSEVIQMGVALLSYGVLAAAILKAREISPNRGFLQPSVVFGDMGNAAAAHAAPGAPNGAANPAPANPTPVKPLPASGLNAPAASYHAVPPPVIEMLPQAPQLPPPAAPQIAHGQAAAVAALPPPPPNLPPGTLSLRVGPRYLVVMPGLRLLEHQVPGLRPTTPGGPIAEVTRNPQDPSVLGLTNLSQSSWNVVTPSGTQRQIQSGQTVKMSPGTRLDFGGIVDGEVR